MTCYHPLLRVEYQTKFEVAKDGHEYKKAKVIKPKGPIEMYKDTATVHYQRIPCWKCIGCRLEYSKQWATRCVLESKCYDNNWFLTLTYDDDHLPMRDKVINEETGEAFFYNEEWKGCLEPRDLQLFLKKLRKHWKNKYNHDNIRFFACGEYGSQGKRPHYHIILFNLPIAAEKLKFKFVNEEYNPVYECDEIAKIWGKGLIGIGEVTFSSCAYVARYITKKQNGPESKDYYAKAGQIPEFVRMSRKPGIGKQYFEEHKEEIYKTDKMYMSTVLGNQLTLKPPKYYDKLFDIEYPEEMDKIKKTRKRSGENAEKLKLSKTSLTTLEQLHIEEKTKNLKAKQLIRSLD